MHENIVHDEETHVRIVQQEVRYQHERYIIQIQVAVHHVQHENIIQQHDEHVQTVQHDIIVQDEAQRHCVQAEQQVRHELPE
jgi:hypothetical protein